MTKKAKEETKGTAVIAEAGEATDKAEGKDLKMVDGVEVEIKPKAQRYFTTREEAEAVDPPRLCTACGENPKWVVQKRDTKLFWHWSKCRSCETERQRVNRAKRKARNTALSQIVTASVAQILAGNGFETVKDIEKAQSDWTSLKGIGPKSVKTIAEFMQLNNLA